MSQTIKKYFIILPTLVAIMALTIIGASAKPTLDLSKAGVIVVNLQTPDKERKPVPGYGFELIHVANALEKDGELIFEAKSEFAAVGVDFNKLDTASASKAAAKALADHAKSNQLSGQKGKTDQAGKLVYGNVKMGVHLLVPQNPPGVSGYYLLDPILVSLPFLNQQGNAWKYAINVNPKLEEEDETTTVPDDGTTLPDDETTWPEESTTPTTQPDDSQETTVPTDQSGQGSGDDPNLPQTGLLRWPIPVLSSAGVILFGLGWADVYLKKRKKDDE